MNPIQRARKITVTQIRIDVAPSPLAARVAGATSILIWVTVIFLARWIGFTKGYDFAVPDDVNFEF